MNFVFGSKLTDSIQAITKKDDLRCAVAFWGHDAASLLKVPAGHKVRAICNLKSGGTNPYVILKLRRRRGWIFKQCDTLHAKVYLSKGGALVGSANASANGLALEGREQESWIEAGMRVTKKEDLKAIDDWFEFQWNTVSSRIANDDIQEAITQWKNRQRLRVPPVLPPPEMPLPTWYIDRGDIEPEVANIRKALKTEYNAAIRRQIVEGVDATGAADFAALKSGRRVLYWKRNDKGVVDQKEPMYWIELGQSIRRAYRYRGYKKLENVVLGKKIKAPQGLDPESRKFRAAFTRTMNGKKYTALRADYSGAWFTAHRLKLIQEFWADMEVALQRIKS